jgi:hypothetical protein
VSPYGNAKESPPDSRKVSQGETDGLSKKEITNGTNQFS